MQNSLVELWGLVQYVEPTGTLLGDLSTFRKVFCRRRRSNFGSWPGTRAATASCHGSAEDPAPSGAGIPRPAFHPTAMQVIRIRNERCGTVALRRRDRISSRAIPLCLFRQATATSADPVSTGAWLLPSLRSRQAWRMLPPAFAAYKRASRRRRPWSTCSAILRMRPKSKRLQRNSPSLLQPATLAGELARVESFVARARSLPDDAKAQRFQEAIKVILDLGRKGEAVARRWCLPSRSPPRIICETCC